MFDLSIWRCTPELKALAQGLAVRSQAAEPGRIADERKKRNYADFWTPIAANEPFRVVLSHMRDRCVMGTECLGFTGLYQQGSVVWCNDGIYVCY